MPRNICTVNRFKSHWFCLAKFIQQLKHKVVASGTQENHSRPSMNEVVLPQANFCFGSAVAAARLAILCTKQWRVWPRRTTRAPVFTGRERQLGVRFILLVPQLATALFLKRKFVQLNIPLATPHQTVASPTSSPKPQLMRILLCRRLCCLSGAEVSIQPIGWTALASSVFICRPSCTVALTSTI